MHPQNGTHPLSVRKLSISIGTCCASFADGSTEISASDIEVGDTVMCHGMYIGTVVHKFLSQTGEEVYDIKLVYGPFRVAALEDDVVIKYRPRR